MELFKLTGTNAVEHWVNPLKISRVTFSPATTTTMPGIPTPENLVPEPIMINEPASLVIHLDTGFAIQTADNVADLIDKLDKVG
jgi:hypothetical protein